MAAKHDAVINELNFKIDKLIKLYISSLEQNKSLESKIQDLQSELENLQRENKDLNNKLKTTRVASAISEGNGSYEAKMRINQLVAGDSFGQIFITDTNREHLDRILHKVGSDYKIFRVEQGVVREMEAEQ